MEVGKLNVARVQCLICMYAHTFLYTPGRYNCRMIHTGAPGSHCNRANIWWCINPYCSSLFEIFQFYNLKMSFALNDTTCPERESGAPIQLSCIITTDPPPGIANGVHSHLNGRVISPKYLYLRRPWIMPSGSCTSRGHCLIVLDCRLQTLTFRFLLFTVGNSGTMRAGRGALRDSGLISVGRDTKKYHRITNVLFYWVLWRMYLRNI